MASHPENQKIILPKEVWTVYAKQHTEFQIKRLLSSETGLTLLSYQINTAEPEAAYQTFISNNKFSNEHEPDIIKSSYKSFNWTPFQDTITLFVQIEPTVFKDEMQALNVRQAIEQKIGVALRANGYGKWIAGDLGPGGVNMLFEVADMENAISTILDALSKTGLDEKTIIGRRVYTDTNDWFYEVVYPFQFNGQFLTW